MARPGEAVAARQGAHQPQRVHSREEQNEANQRQGRPDEVQPAVGPVGVLGEIMRVELGEAFVVARLLIRGGIAHGALPGIGRSSILEMVILDLFRWTSNYAGGKLSYASSPPIDKTIRRHAAAPLGAD